MSIADIVPRDPAPMVSAVAICFSVVVALYAFFSNRRAAKILKIIDVINHCANRYSIIADIRDNLSHPSFRANFDRIELEKREELYFRRYWGLKSDQFDFWLCGFVDHDTFSDWANHTVSSFGGQSSMYVGWYNSFDRGWDYFKNSGSGVSNPKFVNFCEELKSISIIENHRTRYSKLMDVIQDLERCFARDYRRDFHKLMTFEEYRRSLRV